MARNPFPVSNTPSHAAVREAVIQALADALVAAWRRDNPGTALH